MSCIAPGTAKLAPGANKDLMTEQIPLGRMGDAFDIAMAAMGPLLPPPEEHLPSRIGDLNNQCNVGSQGVSYRSGEDINDFEAQL